MPLSLTKRLLRSALCGAALLGLANLSARAGDLIYQTNCPAPVYPGQPVPPAPGTTAASPTESGMAPDFAGPRAPAGVGESVAFNDPGAYLDSALIKNQFRLRFSAAYDDNRPDRAEYLYPKCGCFGPPAPGPIKPETRIDFQDITAYTEVALGDRFSGFLEVPYVFINPDQNANANGFGDLNFGFKFAFLKDSDKVATFQLRTYVPTGNTSEGLGTDHVSLEPSLLYFQQVTDRMTFEAQLTDWIPVGGTDFAGNVFSYGAGVGYTIYQTDHFRIVPVLEMFGWTVLDGKGFVFPDSPPNSTSATGYTKNAAGDTILNLKGGVRFYMGENQSFYAGYGRALTGDVWYKDIVRVEYRLNF